MRIRTLVVIAFLLAGAGCLFAQAPSAQPAAQGTGIAPSQNPGASLPLPVPVFQFRLRAAFMLTPVMVAAIQSAAIHSQNSKVNNAQPLDKEAVPAWDEPILRDVSLTSPLGIKIQGDQLIAMIVFMPVELVKKDLTMLVQNQIWAKSPDNSIQMNTSVHTIRVPLGALFYYYPLGGDNKQGAPVAIEILVNQK